MAGGKRPGGLTALAVINFVFFGLAVIVLLIGFGGLALIQKGIEEAEKSGGKYEGISIGMAYLKLGIMAVSTILLLISGIGYIGIKKFLGRTMGNAYAIVSLGGTVFGLVLGGASFDFWTILFSIYPLLTLFLLNTTFKEDFVN